MGLFLSSDSLWLTEPFIMPHKIFKKIKKTISLSLFLVAVIGLALSLTAFFYIKQWELKIANQDKIKQSSEYMYLLRQKLTTFGNIIGSVHGLANVHYPFTRQNFAQFVKSDILSQSGIHALQWIPVVSNSQRKIVETETEGIDNFNFWEFSPNGHRQIASIRQTYYPVLFTEQKISNEETLGYDVGSSPVLREAFEAARDGGKLTASGAVLVRIASDELLGFCMFLPIYQGDSTTLKMRQRNLVGFAVGVFIFNELVEHVLRLPKQKTNEFLILYDHTPQSVIQQLYAPNWYSHKVHSSSKELWSTPLDFGGRLWHITLLEISDDQFLESWYAWMVLSIGLLFTMGLLRYIYVVLTHAQRAEELVAKRTKKLFQANQALNHEIKVREQLARELETSRQHFQAIFNEAPIGIAQTDLDGKILNSNRALQTLLRYREPELTTELTKFAHPEDANKDQSMLGKMLAGKYDTYRFRKRYLCKNGAIVWTNQSCSIVRDIAHPFIINMIEDITERKNAEEARLKAEKKYREIFENAIEGIFQCQLDGHYFRVNPAFVRIFGYDSAEQVYNEITDIGQQLYINSHRRVEFVTMLRTRSKVQDFEYQAHCRDGRVIWVNETAQIVRNNNQQILYYEGTVEDITERKYNDEKLRYAATHDQLTGLLNRTSFKTSLTKALGNNEKAYYQSPKSTEDSIQESEHIDFAVLFVDLDRFKIINDSLGHLVGDQLLTGIAHRLAKEISENGIVARFGGDEFAVMLEKFADLTVLEQRVDGIQQQLSQPYTVKSEVFNTTASIGIALSNQNYASADDVLRDADTAMYEAKKQGRGKSVIFKPGMHTNVVNMLRMESELRKALERGEFRLHYQPIISLENQNTVGLEALVRWEHPQLGLVSPDKFIPLAEDSGLIKELGLWVFETACTQLRRWQTQFSHHAELGMNINVSPVQLKQPLLVRQIQDIIEKTGIKGSTCRVEITESAMMHDPEAALSVLNELKNLEVLLYIDDFGTGYSSLSYLQRFPIDALKIDKSFINAIEVSWQQAQVVGAIIALGEAFNLKVVAEGVENESQVSMLKKANCHHVQGYFFSRPKDSQAIENYLRSEISQYG